VRLTHGSRDTYAISAPAYREASRRIARMLAEHYGTHSGLRGWHVHNEYGTPDFGPHAARAFRTWLRGEYGTLDALNEAWWSAFWSQRYSDWEQVQPPLSTQYLHNPAQTIDFRRFTSDEMLACLVEQTQEIRTAGSSVPVTTNFMLPSWNHLEQWSWADQLDLISVDHYLETTGPDAEAHVAYGSDLVRSWADGPWVLMEQNPSGIKVDGRTFAKSPERMIRNSLGYVARGSQSSLFFQWRQSLGGSEQWHGALVPHAGADSTTFRGAAELGTLLEKLAEIVEPPADGPLIESEVGILWDANAWWALETPDLPSDQLSYPQEIRAVHRALWRAGVPADFVRPGGSGTASPAGSAGAAGSGSGLASRYRLLIVPCQYPIGPDLAAQLTEYVTEGGNLLVTYLSGLADEHLQVIPGGYPGALRGLLGVRGLETHPLPAGEVANLHWADVGDDPAADPIDPDGFVRTLAELQITEWAERLEATDAEVLARHFHGDLSGSPAITRARRGTGTATYLSTKLTQESLDEFLAWICRDLGIEPTVHGATSLGVEAVRRRGKQADFVFLLHHGDGGDRPDGTPVRVRATGVDLLTGTPCSEGPFGEGLILQPGGYAVIRVAPRSEVAVRALPRAEMATRSESPLPPFGSWS
jgi:beta-galactosidase